jgi:hypothetical protein
MEATVLIKVLDESEGAALSFDMDDFKFLSHTSMAAFFWEQQDRFEVLRSSKGEVAYDADIPQEGKDGWYMYWIGNGSGGSDTDALLAWKILLSQGYDGYLLWDCTEDGMRDGCHVILTEYVGYG